MTPPLTSAELRVLARELLVLEQAQRARALTEEELERWRVLVTQVFEERGAPARSRSSTRMAALHAARVRQAERTHAAFVEDLSQIGLRLVVSDGVLAQGQSTVVETVRVGGADVALGIRCRIAWARTDGGRQFLGLEFEDADEAQLQRYFEGVYYPLYLAHLTSLTK